MPDARTFARHRRWLLELTALPTAAGCEDRVIDWVVRWAARRRDLRLRRDRSGNLIIRLAAGGSGRPVIFTAHLDHPAFVVRAPIDGREVELEFRGGVHDPYFAGARIEIFGADGRAHGAVIRSLDPSARPFKRVAARLDRPAEVVAGGIGRWAWRGRGGHSVVENGLLHAPACDDLAGVAAALSALDVLRTRRAAGPVGVLLTRAEEIGFLGAIGACKAGSIPKRSRLICLENSRSFADSPIGAGPILRVGDRLSVFSPELTNRLSLLLQEYQAARPRFKAQRKLMPGGVCEASTFSAYGYQASCVCLPLGNYHNMVDIDDVQAGRRPARTGPEIIAIADYKGMIDLLVHFARELDRATVKPIRERMEDIYRKRSIL